MFDKKKWSDERREFVPFAEPTAAQDQTHAKGR